MANYYTQFSRIFDVGLAENAALAESILEEMQAEAEEEGGFYCYVGFCMQRDQDTGVGRLWIHSEENGDPEQVITFVKRCAETMDLSGTWGFAWALSCSKPRLDGYGGGAQLIDLGQRKSIDWIDCSTWLDERTQAVVKDDASGPVNVSNPASPAPAEAGVVAGQGGAA